MLVFALDTSTSQGTVGWVKIGDGPGGFRVEGFATCSAPATPGHAETLLDRIAAILSYGGYRAQDIDLLVFCRGPGSFTGVRIGLSTIKGLGLASGIPAVGLSSLEAIALSSGRTGAVAAITDARRKELYGAVYRIEDRDGLPGAERLMEERVGDGAAILAACDACCPGEPISFAGSGVPACRQAITEKLLSRAVILPECLWASNPFWMARIGHQLFLRHGAEDLDTIGPNYLREPDAKLPGARRE